MEPPGDLEWVWVRAYSKELQQLQIFFVKKNSFISQNPSQTFRSTENINQESNQ
jgi:hypothetical protein